MTFERNPGPPAEPAPTPAPQTGREPTPVQVRLQILSTEHWSLLASRGLAWNESFTRAGMYLSTLSASMVALGLIGGVAGFGSEFLAFGLVILPVILFIGIGTWLRMGAANYHDAQAIYGMNRIRGAYLEIAPELRPYFVMGVHDDPAGIGITMAVPPGTPTIVHIVASTPFLVMILNAVVGGGIAALAAVAFMKPDLLPTLGVGFAAFIVVAALQLAYAGRAIRSGQRIVEAMFPTPGTVADPSVVHGARVAGPPDAATGDRPGA
ncbi:MAG: hypothetical protein M3Q66_10630 [Chloroflexota bacterium]|nr:hypothetical protein [Chloroflexota bacterium]